MNEMEKFPFDDDALSIGDYQSGIDDAQEVAETMSEDSDLDEQCSDEDEYPYHEIFS